MKRMRFFSFGILVASVLTVALAPPATAQPRGRINYQAARERMVRDVIIGTGIENERVIQAMATTPRHEFVPREERRRAYLDMSLPIGSRQTISSPFIVAFMTEALDPQPGDRVLEIGTGSGYQAAVLSPLVKSVYTIEIVESLGEKAARTLERLGYDNVHVRVGDGFQGWPEHAPFDKIIVTCSPEDVPRPLVEQLSEGGRMVIPVGERYQQTLYSFTKKDGKLEEEVLRPTLFVPMTGTAEELRDAQPDPLNPQVVNGGFEADFEEGELMPGWYYQRQIDVVEDPRAPQGNHCAKLENRDPGRISQAMQGFAIDGRKVGELKVSGWAKTQGVAFGRTRHETPKIAVTFYDSSRKDLGSSWINVGLGTSDWSRLDKTFRVPHQAREAILRIGLFGSTGTAWIDNVRMETRPR